MNRIGVQNITRFFIESNKTHSLIVFSRKALLVGETFGRPMGLLFGGNMKRAILVSLLLLLGLSVPVGAESYTEEQAIRAIIGEASNQGYEGMLAIACGIRNRGTLKGVYGLKAKHVDHEPKWVWDLARKAWKESAECDVTKGADHWENTKAFGEPYWAKGMIKTYQCKDHTFYKARS